MSGILFTALSCTESSLRLPICSEGIGASNGDVIGKNSQATFFPAVGDWTPASLNICTLRNGEDAAADIGFNIGADNGISMRLQVSLAVRTVVWAAAAVDIVTDVGEGVTVVVGKAVSSDFALAVELATEVFVGTDEVADVEADVSISEVTAALLGLQDNEISSLVTFGNWEHNDAGSGELRTSGIGFSSQNST